MIVMAGMDETISRLEAETWWGAEKRDKQLTLPDMIIEEKDNEKRFDEIN